MKTLRYLFLFSVALTTSLLAEPNISGVWTVTSDIYNNKSVSKVRLKTEGEKVSGTLLVSGGQEVPVSGECHGTEITWGYRKDWEGNPLSLHYSGKISDDGKIIGSVEVKPMGVTGEFEAVKETAANSTAEVTAIPMASAAWSPSASPADSTDSDRRGLAHVANEKHQTTFYVGTIGNPDNLDELRALVPNEFNSITPENALKWVPLLKDGKLGRDGDVAYDFAGADKLVDFALKHGARVRGHTLVWGRFLPDEFLASVDARLSGAADRKEAARKLVRDHITAVMSHFHGRVKLWDVLNEPLSISAPKFEQTVWLKELGPDYIADVFQMAHAADPDAVLFLNEQFEDYSDARSGFFLKLLSDLVRRGVPIDGVGLQSHVISKPRDLGGLQKFLQKVQSLGVKFELTEIDARAKAFGDGPERLELQGKYLGELVRMAKSFPNCTGVTFWGWSDKHSWYDTMPYFKADAPNAPLLFDLKDQPKSAYREVLAALANAKN